MKISVKLNDKVMSQDVRELGFRTRTENCLLRAKFNTVNDLIERYDSIKSVKGLGKNCVKEINSKIIDLCVEQNGEKFWLDTAALN